MNTKLSQRPTSKGGEEEALDVQAAVFDLREEERV